MSPIQLLSQNVTRESNLWWFETSHPQTITTEWVCQSVKASTSFKTRSPSTIMQHWKIRTINWLISRSLLALPSSQMLITAIMLSTWVIWRVDQLINQVVRWSRLVLASGRNFKFYSTISNSMALTSIRWQLLAPQPKSLPVSLTLASTTKVRARNDQRRPSTWMEVRQRRWSRSLSQDGTIGNTKCKGPALPWRR